MNQPRVFIESFSRFRLHKMQSSMKIKLHPFPNNLYYTPPSDTKSQHYFQKSQKLKAEAKFLKVISLSQKLKLNHLRCQNLLAGFSKTC